MKITEVRIFPTESRDGKLKAFATMTFDDWFVVRNVKVIQGNNGLFVAMPSRKAVTACSKCQYKNVIGSKYCNQCGAQVHAHVESHHGGDRESHGGSHMDIAHPITQECRVYIQDKILEAYSKEAPQEKGSSEPVEKTAKPEPVEEKPAEKIAEPEPDAEKPVEESAEPEPVEEKPTEETTEPKPVEKESAEKTVEPAPVEEKSPDEAEKKENIIEEPGSDIAL